MQAYCVKCRGKKEMKSAKAVTMKNGKPATQGICPTCGTKMFKIGKAQSPQVVVLTYYERDREDMFPVSFVLFKLLKWDFRCFHIKDTLVAYFPPITFF